uniref:Uncharacterized protein n=1 Tax=viral metagenome TaxID=1070528 RepID=A0A6M3K9W7_9ZZZZ
MDWKGVRKSYAHHRNLLSRGHTEISLFYGIIQMSLIVWLALRDMVTIHREWVFVVIPGIVIFAATVQYLVGYFMDRFRVIEDLQEWDMSRMPQIRELLKRNGKE